MQVGEAQWAAAPEGVEAVFCGLRRAGRAGRGTSRVALGSAQAFSPAVCGVAGPCGRFAVVGCQGPRITPVPLINYIVRVVLRP